MRTFLLSALLSSCLVSCAQAAPCYGTKLPEKQHFFIGVQSYSVFQRYLEGNCGKLRSQQEFFLLSYGVLDWLSLDLKGGAGTIEQHPSAGDELDYHAFLAGGYGFRVRLYNHNKAKAVFGFQHISAHPETVSLENSKHKAVLDDWQFSALISYDCKRFTPYLGARWSRQDYIHWIDKDRNREKSDLTKSAGLIIGMDIPLSEKFWLNLEGQFFDSEALAVSANFSF